MVVIALFEAKAEGGLVQDVGDAARLVVYNLIA